MPKKTESSRWLQLKEGIVELIALVEAQHEIMVDLLSPADTPERQQALATITGSYPGVVEDYRKELCAIEWSLRNGASAAGTGPRKRSIRKRLKEDRALLETVKETKKMVQTRLGCGDDDHAPDVTWIQ